MTAAGPGHGTYSPAPFPTTCGRLGGGGARGHSGHTNAVDSAEEPRFSAETALIRAGELDPAPFVTARFPLTDWEAAWPTVTGKASLKTVVMMQDALQESDLELPSD